MSEPSAVRPDRAARQAAGRLLRKQVPRKLHGDFKPPAKRDSVAILAEGDATRVATLVPERYRRMLESPFAYLRGAAAVMANDLAGHPAAGISVQACGDCHLMNFGAFATPENNILFDINDFDESLPGVDFTVDVKRLAASVAVAALADGFSRRQARTLAAGSVSAYRERMMELADMRALEIWHSRVDLETEVAAFSDAGLRRQLAQIIRKARGSRDRDDNFPHLAADGAFLIADRPPTIFHFAADAKVSDRVDAVALFNSYGQTLQPEARLLLSRFELADIAFKAVGVGSVGTFCCVGLFGTADGDPLFLQVKEAGPSVLERLSPDLRALGHPGRRVVEAQRILQAASDSFLGWTQDAESGRNFYVRSLKNRRLGAVSEITAAAALQDYANLCGRTLARAHARSGDSAMMAGYMGSGTGFEDALGQFAMAYAAQTVEDHAALKAAKPELVVDGKKPRGRKAPA